MMIEWSSGRPKQRNDLQSCQGNVNLKLPSTEEKKKQWQYKVTGRKLVMVTLVYLWRVGCSLWCWLSICMRQHWHVTASATSGRLRCCACHTCSINILPFLFRTEATEKRPESIHWYWPPFIDWFIDVDWYVYNKLFDADCYFSE